MILQIILWVMIALNVASICWYPYQIGKPREPYSPGMILYAFIYATIAISTYLYILFGVLK